MKLAFTGHRPAGIATGLGLKSDKAYSQQLADIMEDICTSAIKHTKASHVISGGALGIDQAAARASLSLGIKLSLYLPFDGFSTKWPRASQQALADLVADADEVKYICEPGYHPSKLQRRNEAMVDDADRLAAVWSGGTGGTKNCLDYARQQSCPITQCWNALAHSAAYNIR
jgi:uncharacterized phage-like protein YoqJ